MPRILVIDDEPLARETLRLILTAHGYEVVEAANGDEGLERERAEPVDLVITDIIMPEKEGIETIMEFKRHRPGLKIIAISGGGRLQSETPLRLASRAGADLVLPKPFGAAELIETVRRALESSDEKKNKAGRKPR